MHPLTRRILTIALVCGLGAIAVAPAIIGSAGESDPTHYTVVQGDTLQSIADTHGVSLEALRLANNWPEGTGMSPRAGLIIHIPEVSPSPPTSSPSTTSTTTTTSTTAPRATTTSTSTTAPRATTTVPRVTTTTVRPPITPAPTTAPPSTASQFTEGFETSAGFYDRFDFGYSGPDPNEWPAGESFLQWEGDHNMNCEGPTTSRTINVSRSDFSDLFWWCAPGGDAAKGHVMTAVQTVSYNIAWFSPKQYFKSPTKVCWDINLTNMGKRKWTQVLFVPRADAERSGGNLGFTSPDFRDPGGPTTGVFASAGTMAGAKFVYGNFQWFQNQDSWTTGSPVGAQIEGVTDKATRYRHCLEEVGGNTIRLTQNTPSGTRTFDVPGQMPDGEVRVVFEDDNYDPPKDAEANDDLLTWHWDNIAIS